MLGLHLRAHTHSRYPGRSFDQAEADLSGEWHRSKGKSTLTWEEARHAARDSWKRISDTFLHAARGDSHRDGK